jgi:AraC-like DNA-binding protein
VSSLAVGALGSSRSPADVVALLVGREAEARIQGGLRGRAKVHVVGTCRALLAHLRVGPAAAVIVEPRDAEGVPTAPTVRRLRGEFPLVPVLAYCPFTQPDARDLLDVVQAGVSGLLVRGVDDAGFALDSALAAAEDECTARRAMVELGRFVDGPARPVLEYCLSHARSAPTVLDVARALGMHPKTLSTRLARAGLPPAQIVIGWCRLLMAARLMEDVGRPLEQVALHLNFPSGASLRNMLARYTGLKPSEVRENGGFTCVLFAFRQAISARGDAPASQPTAVGAT